MSGERSGNALVEQAPPVRQSPRLDQRSQQGPVCSVEPEQYDLALRRARGRDLARSEASIGCAARIDRARCQDRCGDPGKCDDPAEACPCQPGAQSRAHEEQRTGDRDDCQEAESERYAAPVHLGGPAVGLRRDAIGHHETEPTRQRESAMRVAARAKGPCPLAGQDHRRKPDDSDRDCVGCGDPGRQEQCIAPVVDRAVDADRPGTEHGAERRTRGNPGAQGSGRMVLDAFGGHADGPAQSIARSPLGNHALRLRARRLRAGRGGSKLCTSIGASLYPVARTASCIWTRSKRSRPNERHRPSNTPRAP